MKILQRPHNDQQVPTPLLIDDQQPDEITLYITEDINNVDHTSLQTSIVPIPQIQTIQEYQDTSQVSKYQVFSEFLIVELNRRYDLRPRAGPCRPPKNPVIIEPQVKTVETQTTSIQPLNHPNGTSQIDKTVLTTFNIEK